MEAISNAWVVKALNGKEFKNRFIKLALLLGVVFLSFFSNSMGYIIFAFCVTYITFEFSADSIFWIMLAGVCVPYISVFFVHVLMWIFIVTLLIRLVVDLVKKRIDYKNWRFITLISLFGALALLILLPLSTTYSFMAQLKRLSLFASLILAVIYIKQINVKHTLLFFVISVVSICGLFVIAEALNADYAANVYKCMYSNGVVSRFGVFNNDPNFTGATLICALASWFFLYRKNYINNYWYFAGLALIGYFAVTTISKATYLIIGIFALYVVVENVVITIKTKNPKHLLELLWYVAVLAVVFAIGWKYVNAMYQRIFNPNAGMWAEGDNLSFTNLTTGRSDIWIGYFKEIFGSWQMLLFGAGASAGFVNRPAHSLPIEYLYRYGVLGVLVMLAIFVVSAWPYIKKVKPYSFVPMVIITGIFCSIGSISAKYIYIFALVFLTLCYNGIKYEKLKESVVFEEEQPINTKLNNEIEKNDN